MSRLGEGGDSRFDKSHIRTIHDSISSLGSIFIFCVFLKLIYQIDKEDIYILYENFLGIGKISKHLTHPKSSY